MPCPVGRGLDPAFVIAAETSLTHSPAVDGGSVGAACMRPVPVCPTIPFLHCDGAGSMRRGGIYAPAKWYGCWAFTGCGVCILPCRAGVHARRTNQYFKFFNVRRAKSPALQGKKNSGQPGNGEFLRVVSHHKPNFFVRPRAARHHNFSFLFFNF